MDTNIRAIDGSAVTVSLDATPDDLHPWTTRTMLEYAGRGTHQIIAGNRKFPAAAIGATGIELTESATVDSWTVQYGSSEQYDNQSVYIGHLTAVAVLGRAFGCESRPGSGPLMPVADASVRHREASAQL